MPRGVRRSMAASIHQCGEFRCLWGILGLKTVLTMFRGDKNGGLKNRDDCAKLPSVLQGGCYWRWNWAKGDLNRWDVNYERVSCPQRLVDISGCEAQGM